MRLFLVKTLPRQQRRGKKKAEKGRQTAIELVKMATALALYAVFDSKKKRGEKKSTHADTGERRKFGGQSANFVGKKGRVKTCCMCVYNSIEFWYASDAQF